MRLLAIDTGSEACSVGVADGARTWSRSEIVGRGHAEILMGLIESALAEAAIEVSTLERVAVTVGPGSFTGLRVGVAAARGLALALGQTAVGIGTLAVHAEAARAIAGQRPVLAVLAAGRGELYGAVYDADGAELIAPQAATPETFAALLESNSPLPPRKRGSTLLAAGTDAPLVLAGSGVDLVLAALGQGTHPEVAHRNAVSDISALVRLARNAPSATASPRPLYLRPPDAKPQGAAQIAHR
jgi:tRNA threonylcarbamoyl adenosine modification protein YeaZ